MVVDIEGLSCDTDALERILGPNPRAVSLAACFAWRDHRFGAEFWSDEYDNLATKMDLTPKAREELTRILSLVPKPQSPKPINRDGETSEVDNAMEIFLAAILLIVLLSLLVYGASRP